ncbi:MAG: hypothetical protein AAFP70_04495 [Calditrichota bacterium]
MICPNCGARNPDDSLVCTRCQLVFARHKTQVNYQTRPETPPIQQVPGQPLSTAQPVEDPTIHYSDNNEAREDLVPEVASTKRPPEKVDTGIGYLPIAIGIIAVGLLSIAGFLLMPEETVSSEMSADIYFAEAEQLYSEKNYLAAQKYYEQFIVASPESPLTRIAAEKIKEIDQHFTPLRESKIDSLLTLALSAFEKQRYVTPKNDNVLSYTREVFALDPTNADAQNIQAMVQNIYSRHMNDAFVEKDYREAEQICRKMLLVDPTSIEAQDGLNRLAALSR